MQCSLCMDGLSRSLGDCTGCAAGALKAAMTAAETRVYYEQASLPTCAATYAYHPRCLPGVPETCGMEVVKSVQRMISTACSHLRPVIAVLYSPERYSMPAEPQGRCSTVSY